MTLPVAVRPFRIRHPGRPPGIIMAALLAFLAVAPTAAQIPADTFDLPEIVVTATRMPHHRDAVPVPVTVITGEELRSSGVRTVAEALERSVSAAVVSGGPSGAQTSLFLRGGESDYVKVLVDGVALNDPGGAVDLADLELTNVERIEVVRGPTSVLYGSDAVTGVVQIFTRRGRGAPELTVSALPGLGARRGDGSYPTLELAAELAGGDERLSYAFGLSRFESDGLLPLNNGYRNQVASGRLAVTPAPGTDIAITGRYRDARYHFPTDGAGRVVDENALQDTELQTLAVSVGQRISRRFRVRALLSGAETRRSFQDRPDGPADTLGTFAGSGNQRVRRRSADARLDVLLGTGRTDVLSLGTTVERGGITGDTEYRSAFGPIAATIDERRTTVGAYAQLVARPLPGLDLQLGLRREHAETFGTFDTWRIATAYDLPAGVRARASYGTAFREPTFPESFGSGFGDIGNPDLVPERSRSWELGLERGLGDGRLAVTWFDQHFADLVQFTFATEPGEPNYYNVGGARARGLELVAVVPAAERLAVEGRATVLDTEVTDPGLATDATFEEGAALLRRPGFAASLAARYRWADGSIRLAADHTGARDDVDFGADTFPYPRITLEPVTTIELSGEQTWTALSRDITLLARVANLLDARYQQIVGFPAPGRAVRLGVRVAF